MIIQINQLKKNKFKDKYFDKSGIWDDFNSISKTKKKARWSTLELPNEDISVIYLDVDKISEAYNKKNLCLGCHKKDPKNSIIIAKTIKRKNEIITTKFW